jgi:hypothetical protein
MAGSDPRIWRMSMGSTTMTNALLLFILSLTVQYPTPGDTPNLVALCYWIGTAVGAVGFHFLVRALT